MKRFVFFALMGIFSAFILWFGGFLIFSTSISNMKTDETTHTDAVAALTGGRNRVSEAVKVFNAGLADKLIISGVGHNVTLNQLEKQNHVIVTKNPEDVTLGDQATNTIENAIEVNETIRRNNFRSLRLVTSFYHMPRSRIEILAVNPDVKIIEHPVFSPNVSRKWWKNGGSFRLIASEYNKFMYVYVKYILIKLWEGN